MAKKKIGVEVDEDVWEEFRNYVYENHQRTRGILGNELEHAIEEYMADERPTDQLQRIEDGVAHLKRIVAESESDGAGVSTPLTQDQSARAHAEPRAASKPAPNQPKRKKVEYLADAVRERVADFDVVDGNVGGQETVPAQIEDIVREEYGFKDEIVDEYVNLVIDELGAVDHPEHGNTLVWGERLEHEQGRVSDE